MPTGCRSEYLESKSQQSVLPRGNRRQCEPACDFERGTEDLGSHEFRHDEGERAKGATTSRNFFSRERFVEAPTQLKEERGVSGRRRCGEGPFSVKSAENKDDDVRDRPGRFLRG